MADFIGKKKYQSLGDGVGMPDHIDKQNIRNIIKGYEREHPGEIKTYIEYAKIHSKAFSNQFGIVNKDSGMRYILELPPILHGYIETYMPTVWREKKHFRWFVKNFPELVIPEKT